MNILGHHDVFDQFENSNTFENISHNDSINYSHFYKERQEL